MPVGTEMTLFDSNPKVHAARVKDGKVTFSKLHEIPETDYVYGYTVVAEVREHGTRFNANGFSLPVNEFSFFITFSSFKGFTVFGEGQRSPLIATGNLWKLLPRGALNGG